MSENTEDSNTSSSEFVDRFKPFLLALLVILTPAILLFTTMTFIEYASDLGQLTLLELLELYLIELAVLAVFGFLLYKLLITSAKRYYE